MTIVQLFLFAVLVESVLENVKWVIDDIQVVAGKKEADYKWSASRVIALGVSILFCVMFQADVFAASGFTTSTPFFGAVSTGFIMARGAGFFHDVMKRAQGAS